MLICKILKNGTHTHTKLWILNEITSAEMRDDNRRSQRQDRKCIQQELKIEPKNKSASYTYTQIVVRPNEWTTKRKKIIFMHADVTHYPHRLAVRPCNPCILLLLLWFGAMLFVLPIFKDKQQAWYNQNKWLFQRTCLSEHYTTFFFFCGCEHVCVFVCNWVWVGIEKQKRGI